MTQAGLKMNQQPLNPCPTWQDTTCTWHWNNLLLMSCSSNIIVMSFQCHVPAESCHVGQTSTAMDSQLRGCICASDKMGYQGEFKDNFCFSRQRHMIWPQIRTVPARWFILKGHNKFIWRNMENYPWIILVIPSNLEHWLLFNPVLAVLSAVGLSQGPVVDCFIASSSQPKGR